MQLVEVSDANGVPEGCDYRLIRTEAELDWLCSEMEKADRLAVDTETEGLLFTDLIVGICISPGSKRGYYIPIRHEVIDGVRHDNQLAPTYVFGKLKNLLETKPLTGHNTKFDTQAFWKDGVYPNFVNDTLIEAHLLGTYDKGNRDLKSLASVHFNHKMGQLEDLFPKIGRKKPEIRPATLDPEDIKIYGCEDADYSFRLYEYFRPLMETQVSPTLYDIEMKLMRVVAEMEVSGVPVSKPFLDEKAAYAGEKSKKLNEDLIKNIQDRVGDPEYKINFNSPNQLAELLYEKLGLPIYEYSDSGKPSTKGDVLKRLAQEDELADRILTYRLLSKLKGTFLEKNAKLVHPDARIRGQFNQLGADSGRFSSKQPNLQQVPKDQTFFLWKAVDEDSAINFFGVNHLRKKDDGTWESLNTENDTWGNNFLGQASDGVSYGVRNGEIWEAWKCPTRQFIAAAPNHYILEADYSQIELRIMAGASQEPTLLDAYANGDDVHKRTAAVIFGVPFDEVTKYQRGVGKTINFALLYGAGPKKISEELTISLQEAKDIVNRYFENLPMIKTWINAMKAHAKADYFAKTRFGRIRYFNEINSSKQNIAAMQEREAVNHHIQGAAADVMKIALVRLHDRMQKYFGDKVKIICTVHDSVMLECHESCDPVDVSRVLKDAMEMQFSKWPKLKVDIAYGPAWALTSDLEVEDGELVDRIDASLIPKIRCPQFGREREEAYLGAPQAEVEAYEPSIEEPEPIFNLDIDTGELIEIKPEANDNRWIIDVLNPYYNEKALMRFGEFMKSRKVEEGDSVSVMFPVEEGDKEEKLLKGKFRITLEDELDLKLIFGSCKLKQDINNFDPDKIDFLAEEDTA